MSKVRVMLTAEEFTAETERRRQDTEERRWERLAEFASMARPRWPDLAEVIKEKAVWHLRESKVEKGIVKRLLGLADQGKEHWSDVDRVIRTLAEENGFELGDQWDVLPRSWIFKWSPKDD